MKRHAMATCLLMAALGVCAQAQEQDSLRVINLQEVEVISTRATNSTPVAFTNIGKEQLKKQNFGQDLPYLLSMTPSAITTSDAGAGVGYTTLRVRGTRRHTHQRHRQRYSHQRRGESHGILGQPAGLRLLRQGYAGTARSRYLNERCRSFRCQHQHADG